jgi:hypothetical protein
MREAVLGPRFRVLITNLGRFSDEEKTWLGARSLFVGNPTEKVFLEEFSRRFLTFSRPSEVYEY